MIRYAGTAEEHEAIKITEVGKKRVAKEDDRNKDETEKEIKWLGVENSRQSS